MIPCLTQEAYTKASPIVSNAAYSKESIYRIEALVSGRLIQLVTHQAKCSPPATLIMIACQKCSELLVFAAWLPVCNCKSDNALIQD